MEKYITLCTAYIPKALVDNAPLEAFNFLAKRAGRLLRLTKRFNKKGSICISFCNHVRSLPLETKTLNPKP